MWDWFWSLRGWELLGAVVLGLASICVTVGSAGVWLARAIDGAAAHDQRTCGCWDCQGRRARAVRRAESKIHRIARSSVGPYEFDMPEGEQWLSTAELDSGMYVEVRGEEYWVKEIRTDIKGYLVSLRNVKTRREAIVIVTFTGATRKYWRPLRYWEKP